MRIISGTHKGRKLKVPKNLPVRPTTDFSKEALFNILRNRIYFDETSVLDLFAGTGNISFEFASRGAPSLISVDSHLGCVQYINKVSEEFTFPIQGIKADAQKFLEKTPSKFDLIFADPPYDFELSHFENIVNTVFERNLLNEEGFLIIEHSKLMDLSTLQSFSELRRYGGSVFSFFGIPEEIDL